jgi:hypothetical protein
VVWTDQVPKVSNCISWVKEICRAGYEAAGASDRWKQIRTAVEAGSKKERDRGTVLLEQLQRDGWMGLYFNPDVKNPDAEDKRHVKIHRESASHISKHAEYYGLKIFDALVNYRPTFGTPRVTPEIECLRRVPFFVGIARAGDHVFVGRNGVVSELHWAEGPKTRDIMEETPLERFAWSSGTLVVPPGWWPVHLSKDELRTKITR